MVYSGTHTSKTEVLQKLCDPKTFKWFDTFFVEKNYEKIRRNREEEGKDWSLTAHEKNEFRKTWNQNSCKEMLLGEHFQESWNKWAKIFFYCSIQAYVTLVPRYWWSKTKIRVSRRDLLAKKCSKIRLLESYVYFVSFFFLQKNLDRPTQQKIF